MTTTVILTWPPAALTPHAKGGWRAKADATKAYKRDSWAAALEAKVACDPTARMTFTYHPPSKRGDCHNVHGRMKAAIDGIAEAMGCNDKNFRITFPPEFGEVVKYGRVIVEIDDDASNWRSVGTVAAGMVERSTGMRRRGGGNA